MKIFQLTTVILLVGFWFPDLSPLTAGDTTDNQVTTLEQEYARVMKQADAMAKTFAEANDDSEQRATIKADLRDLISRAFDLRQKLQRAEVQVAREELKSVEARIAERDQLKETIVRRKLEDLILGKKPSWSSSEELENGSGSAFDIIRAGDIVAVYIEGVLPFNPPDQPPAPPPVTTLKSGDVVSGFPVTVASDGTLQLPLVEPIKVVGLTIREAERKIADQYIQKDILRPEKAKPMLTLVKRKDAEPDQVENEFSSN